MEPFEKFKNAGNLENYMEPMVSNATDALRKGGITIRQYRPVATNWKGFGNHEAEGAPVAIKQTARTTHTMMVWAAVVTQYWGVQLHKFNDRVDEIVLNFNNFRPPAPSTPSHALGPQPSPTTHPTPHSTGGPGARAQSGESAPASSTVGPAYRAALNHAVSQWHSAYNEFVVAGRNLAKRMLSQGPTRRNVQLAIGSGAIPDPLDEWYDPVKNLWTGARNFVDPFLGDPSPSNFLGVFGWMGGAPGLMATAWYMHTYGIDIPGFGKTARPGSDPDAFARFKSLSKWLGPVSAGAAAATGAWTQWSDDSKYQPHMPWTEKAMRSIVRGGADAGAGFAGGLAGEAVGGPVAGAAVGGAATSVTDKVIDHFFDRGPEYQGAPSEPHPTPTPTTPKTPSPVGPP
ncbi:hypothetical protein Athai_45800 [Actinocatenispora thailandica]|uniref:Uncharacterized protein n=1 Tax=Actinocatenispora thailandica TaxID=227318 RepID=A0A7R7DSN7_9ACTN|nr:hypothetical protein [Actinocatenispora thailandica]BCJ37077.1 hypothetical protein Athai_45800 [Actinocatenispora thailandica]